MQQDSPHEHLEASNSHTDGPTNTKRSSRPEPVTRHESEQPLNPTSRPTSNEANEYTYPEGGLAAWLTTFGAWCTLTGGLGLLNSIAPLQSYVATHQLLHYPESSVAWIFSLQLFIVFFTGIQIGPLFDALGPRILTLAGTVCLVTSVLLLGECTEYWHFILDFSVLAGLGSSLLLTPPLATVGHWFNRRRAFATGLAMTGPSVGGIIFPLVFRAVYPHLGFPWATRILALIILGLLIPANLLLRSRLPLQKPTLRDVLPDFKIFLDGDGALVFATAGFFLMELSLFIPIAYITSYCVAAGLDPEFSYQIIAILNAASVVGRGLPGFVADKVGRYNTMVAMLILCMLSTLLIWLPPTLISGISTHTIRSVVIAYAIVFGIASGSNLSLIAPCLGQLCETKNYGRYFATSYFFVSIATLIGIPIAGKLIDAVGVEGAGSYWALILFVGLGYAMSIVCMSAVRIVRVGWGLEEIF